MSSSNQQGASQQLKGGNAEQQTQRQSGYRGTDRRTVDWQGEDYILPDSGCDPLARSEIEEYSGALNGDTRETGEKRWCNSCGNYTARCHQCQTCLVCDNIKTEGQTCKACDHQRHTDHHPMD